MECVSESLHIILDFKRLLLRKLRHNENRDTFQKDLTFKIVTDLM